VKKLEDESDDDIPVAQSIKSDNPWLGCSATASTAPGEITSGYRKLWNNVNESKKKRQEMKAESLEQRETLSEEEEHEEIITQTATNADEMQNTFSEELDEGLFRKTTIEDFSDMPEVTKKTKSKNIKTNSDKKTVSQSDETNEWKVETTANIDPNKFVTMTTAAVNLKSSVPISEQAGEEEDEEEQTANHRRMTLAEAFADDDVVDQFDEEKKRIIESNKPKDIDLTLPGWGDWVLTQEKVGS